MRKKKKFKLNPISIEYENFVNDSCKSKTRYETEWQAKYVADESNKILHCYKCNICGGYHLTASNKNFGNIIW